MRESLLMWSRRADRPAVELHKAGGRDPGSGSSGSSAPRPGQRTDGGRRRSERRRRSPGEQCSSPARGFEFPTGSRVPLSPPGRIKTPLRKWEVKKTVSGCRDTSQPEDAGFGLIGLGGVRLFWWGDCGVAYKHPSVSSPGWTCLETPSRLKRTVTERAEPPQLKLNERDPPSPLPLRPRGSTNLSNSRTRSSRPRGPQPNTVPQVPEAEADPCRVPSLTRCPALGAEHPPPSGPLDSCVLQCLEASPPIRDPHWLSHPWLSQGRSPATPALRNCISPGMHVCALGPFPLNVLPRIQFCLPFRCNDDFVLSVITQPSPTMEPIPASSYLD
ncbi:unnamed protein product [Pleuronectes platessa]|uniref:Uncharacterized protein n=1 Tax=Pleuronectes platessa TaxID=8262 RepID=A0A9N7YMX0_PLEPL|nr:unnamed protein product [Pleuronectes platessa]